MGVSDIFGAVAEKLGLIPAKGSKRIVKFPYTTTAQLGMYPWRFYWNNNWLWRYWLISCVLCFPVFWKISRMANSPGNKKAWAEHLAREAAKDAEHGHH